MASEDGVMVINKAASTMDLYDAINQRLQMARGFCLVIAQDETICGLAETAGHSQSAWGHCELLDQADEMLEALWERIKAKGI